jgi:hypothetical protein
MEGSIPQSESHEPAHHSRRGTYFYAAPLLGVGMVSAAIGIWRVPNPTAALIVVSIGAFYLLSGALLYTSWKGAPKLAMVAWAPFFLVVPVGTILAFFAYRGLRDLSWPSSPSPSEAAQLNGCRPSMLSVAVQAFVTEFGAYENAKGAPLSISRDLHIPRGTFTRFLDDLRIDHRLPTSGADADAVDTLQELLDILLKRQAAAGTSY